jgi:hypothetical protein
MAIEAIRYEMAKKTRVSKKMVEIIGTMTKATLEVP